MSQPESPFTLGLGYVYVHLNATELVAVPAGPLMILADKASEQGTLKRPVLNEGVEPCHVKPWAADGYPMVYGGGHRAKLSYVLAESYARYPPARRG